MRNITITRRIWAILSLSVLVGVASGAFLFYRLESIVASLGSQGQNRGMNVISSSLQEIEQVTQRFAAGAEESAAAGEELKVQAALLNDIVGRLSTLLGAAGSVKAESAANRV